MANDDRLVSQKEKKTITFILACEKSGESRGQEIEITNRDRDWRHDLMEKFFRTIVKARLNFSYVFFSVKFLSISITHRFFDALQISRLTLEKFRSFEIMMENNSSNDSSHQIYLSRRTRRKVFVSRKIIVSDRRKPIIVRGIAKLFSEACHRQILAAARFESGK